MSRNQAIKTHAEILALRLQVAAYNHGYALGPAKAKCEKVSRAVLAELIAEIERLSKENGNPA